MQVKVSGRGRLDYEDNHPADYRAFLKAAKQRRAPQRSMATVRDLPLSFGSP